MLPILKMLVDLNDYCLYKVIDLLHFKDQIKFLSICNRLQNVYFQYLKSHKNIELDLNDDSDCSVLDESQHAIQVMAPIIEEFSIDLLGKNLHWFFEFLKYILENCSALLHLAINNRSVSTHQDLRLQTPDFYSNTKLIADRLSNLKQLQLKDLQMLDSDMEILSNSKLIHHLDYLDVSNHKALTGKHIERFYKLKTLKMAKCADFSCKNFNLIFEKLINLRHLDVEFCYQLTDLQVGTIIDNCKLLETLKFNATFMQGYTNVARLNELKNLSSLTVIETARGTLSEIIRYRTIFNEILAKLSGQLTQLKMYFSRYDSEKNLKTYKRLNAIGCFERLELLHLDGYMQCDMKFWSSLHMLAKKNKNLQFINLTYSNGVKQFAVRDFFQFFFSKLENKILRTNLEISEDMLISKNFLLTMIEEFEFHTTKNTSNCFTSDKSLLTLWAVVEIENQEEIKREFCFRKANKFFDIVLEHNYFDYYSSNKYHDNEVYFTELNPLHANRRQSVAERDQELFEIQQYNNAEHFAPANRILKNQLGIGNLQSDFVSDSISSNILQPLEHNFYSTEAFKRRNSLGRARLKLSRHLDNNIQKILKRSSKNLI